MHRDVPDPGMARGRKTLTDPPPFSICYDIFSFLCFYLKLTISPTYISMLKIVIWKIYYLGKILTCVCKPKHRCLKTVTYIQSMLKVEEKSVSRLQLGLYMNFLTGRIQRNHAQKLTDRVHCHRNFRECTHLTFGHKRTYNINLVQYISFKGT